MVDQRRVPAALAGVLLQGAVRAQASGPSRQPAAHPQALQAEAQQGPESGAGQVQLGGGQGAAQGFQAGPQVLTGLGKVSLETGGANSKGR